MADANDAFLRNQGANNVQARAKAQNRASVLQLKLMGQSHPTGLTPNLLRLFEPRPPLEFKIPPEKRKCLPYTGIAQFVSNFSEPGDPEYSPPVLKGETPAQKKARINKLRLEKGAEKIARDLQTYDPSKDPNVTGDPYKTLFVARLNYETTEHRIKREFESYGPIKRVSTIEHSPLGTHIDLGMGKMTVVYCDSKLTFHYSHLLIPYILRELVFGCSKISFSVTAASAFVAKFASEKNFNISTMEGTVFTPALEGMNLVMSEKGEILTKSFLDVCKNILPVLDKFGAAMALVKADIGGNITRLETKYCSNPSEYNLLYSMVEEEIQNKTAKGSSSCTNGLLWLTRAMDFLLELFRNLLDHVDWTMTQACTDSYCKTLKKFHGWLASSSFTVAMKLAPDRKKFMEVIGGTGDVNDDMGKFCDHFSPYLQKNHDFLSGVGFDNLKAS